MSTRAHGATCWQGDHYEHTCQRPSGRRCVDCGQPAGTAWGPYWCPDCDVARLDRIAGQFEEIAAALHPTTTTERTNDE